MFDYSATELFLIIITSIISSWLMYDGFKTKNVPRLIIGFGVGIPSFGIGSFNVWLLAVVVCGVGIWLGRFLDGA